MMQAALLFVQLTAPGGDKVDVNPVDIVSMRDSRDETGHFPPSVNCVLHTLDGKFIAVTEKCETVRMRVVYGEDNHQ